MLLFDFDAGAAACSTSPTTTWIPELGIRYKLGVDGLNLWLVALTTLLFAAVGAVDCRCARPSAPRLFAFHLGARARPPCSARSSRRTWRCSSSSST